MHPTKKAKEEIRRTFLICKSSGNAPAKLEGNVNVKRINSQI
jgi:hypothetical protein